MKDGEQHTERHEAWQIVYWDANTAATVTGATRAELYYYTSSGPSKLIEFQLPRDRHLIDQYNWALKRVWEAGKAARSAEFLALLNWQSK